ncbi:diaminopimelate epimerase [Rhizobium sp. ZPR3]|uniref:Diaminopimelate epimerase n=2 Tax=unclassified Rhizobium TaxID=2613769 RepID=A0AAU7SKE5_9HYPH
MSFTFEKMHANGDDFIIVDCRGQAPFIDEEIVRRLGNRNRGIGFNQLAVMTDCADAAARLAFWNPDGSTLDACGSATRGAAWKLMREARSSRVVLRTERGLLTCAQAEDGLISVDMGEPLLHWTDVPLTEEIDTLRLPLDGSPAACSMGNPHCTFFVEDVEAVRIEERGAAVERHPLFPLGTNVHFVQVIDSTRIRLRIWERGGGISPGSGSCTCGGVVNGIRRGLLSNFVEVECDGGLLKVAWNGAGGVLLTGPVEPAFQGTWLT